jgi:hypothetical protein
LPALGIIGEEQTKQIAAPYKYSNENMTVYGQYTYKNVPYYLVEFSPADNESLITGVLVIDAGTGKIVTDKEIADKIITAHIIIYTLSSQYISSLENTSKYFKNYIEFVKVDIKTTEDAAETMKQQSNFSSIIETDKKIENSTLLLKENTDQKIIIAKKISAGDGSYESVAALKALDDKYISLLEDYLELRKEYRTQSIRYYDLGTQIGFNPDRYNWAAGKDRYLAGIDSDTKVIEDELKVEKENKVMIDGYISFASDSMDSRLPKTKTETETPGFTFLIAVSALLLISLLIEKRKK